ncbi:MAG: M28 family peptidase [Bacteroidota bacterium]|nr:M28 family peptidase [Bacteroidota bacterium]
MKKLLYITLLITAIAACKNDNPKDPEKIIEPVAAKYVQTSPNFNEDSAFAYVAAQCNFGPRVPSTNGHKLCADYLIKELKKYADKVEINGAPLKTFDGKTHQCKNIIASFNLKASKRVMLSAHWDTRPFADQDTKDIDKPIDGANDGGSGVGVLLEIARQLKLKPTEIGIDIILFDLEDYGQPGDSDDPHMEDSYCIGSQYWAKNLHIKNYMPAYGILLDMVGAPDAQFTKEKGSMEFAPAVVEKVWATGQKLGYTNFVNEPNTGVIDDHYYVNQIAKIPIIDIIEYTKDKDVGDHFSHTWHTHNDNIKNISKFTLKNVGQTVMEVIYGEK